MLNAADSFSTETLEGTFQTVWESKEEERVSGVGEQDVAADLAPIVCCWYPSCTLCSACT